MVTPPMPPAAPPEPPDATQFRQRFQSGCPGCLYLATGVIPAAAVPQERFCEGCLDAMGSEHHPLATAHPAIINDLPIPADRIPPAWRKPEEKSERAGDAARPTYEGAQAPRVVLPDADALY